MSDELKPCPFCGFDKIIQDVDNTVFCENCGSSFFYMRWNDRPLEDALRAELEFAKNDLATRLTELAASLAEVERLRDLTATHAMKLCPGCEKLTEHEKYCEVWECRECGLDSESGFVGLQ